MTKTKERVQCAYSCIITINDVFAANYEYKHNWCKALAIFVWGTVRILSNKRQRIISYVNKLLS